MTYDWVLLKTLIFIITPYFVMLALASRDEDDDGGGGGPGELVGFPQAT